MSLPTDDQERKDTPIFSGVLMYFPDAIAEVARVSLAGSKQHHPDKSMHWDKSKSTDEPDCVVRHLMERGKRDKDGQRHSAKAAWRALANLQREIEEERARPFDAEADSLASYNEAVRLCGEKYKATGELGEFFKEQ